MKDVRWAIKIFSLGLAVNLIAAVLVGIFPGHRVFIAYAGAGVIVYLMLYTIRNTDWKLPFKFKVK
ncbi:MAG: hypothetical protein SCH39_13225 [Methanosarcinales archaeon]|nr:hypothetical protein [Methanosarcinales archaeon]